MNEEPSTSNLLLKQFTPMECRTLFPKRSSKAIQAEVVKLKEKLRRIEAMPIGKEKAEMRRTFGYTCKLFQKQYKSKGLRIDLQLIDHFTNQERWVDTTCTVTSLIMGHLPNYGTLFIKKKKKKIVTANFF